MRRAKDTRAWTRSKSDRYAVQDGCWFDLAAAERVRAFFKKFLRHSKGRWAGQPFVLLPWQWEDVIAPLFGWKRADGTRRFRKAYIEVPKKNGKALDIETEIPTPEGWARMGTLAVGDKVFDEKGRTCRVVAATPVMKNHSCYELTFSDGARVVADAEHEWRTRTLKSEYKVMDWTTEEIARTVTARRDGARNHSVAVAEPLTLPQKRLPIPPYILGIWLADGSSADGRITVPRQDAVIVDNMRAESAVVSIKSYPSKPSVFTVRIKGVQKELRRMGLLGNKHIPRPYLRAGIKQRLSLLQGLMDGDGYASKANQCEWTTTGKKLMEGFIELARTLGIKPTVKEARAQLRGKDYGPYWRVQFWARKKLEVFRVQRKLVRSRRITSRRRRSQSRQIVAVQKTRSVPVRCIQVDSPSGLYLATRSMISTHNSTLCAGISLYLLIADDEPGSEVYSAAADREQAGIIYGEAASMVRASKELSAHVIVTDSRKTLGYPKANSIYRALSADVPTKAGYNIHGLVFDELHTQPNRDLWDMLAYGGVARRQPMTIAITTAGWDRNSICWEEHEYARRVAEGEIRDWSYLSYIRAAGPKDDWRKPKTWRKANPSIGVTVKEEELAAACKEAQVSPTKENGFKRFRLSLWTQQAMTWLSMEAWDRCGGRVDARKLEGRKCFAGLDLSSRRDVTAFVLIFPPEKAAEKWKVLPFFWIPRETARGRESREGVPYTMWAQDGLIDMTPGEVVDYDRVRVKIGKIGERYNIREIALDRWNATQLGIQLGDDGFTVLEFGQGYRSMSAPTKELEALVVSRQLAHGGNPVLRWMASNTAVEMDAAENIKPSKKRSRARIDGIVAGIMGLARAMVRSEDEGTVSVYAERGMLTV